MNEVKNRIGTAWQTGVKIELNRAAEELAERGHLVSVIYDALEELLLSERARGASDEVEERITDVMDRLVGWCHVSNHINTKAGDFPSPPMPGEATHRNGSPAFDGNYSPLLRPASTTSPPD